MKYRNPKRILIVAVLALVCAGIGAWWGFNHRGSMVAENLGPVDLVAYGTRLAPTAAAPVPQRAPASIPASQSASPAGEDSAPQKMVLSGQKRLQNLVDRGQILRAEDSKPSSDGSFQRVRILRTSFKYPMVRVIENFEIDQATGREFSRGAVAMVADHVAVKLVPGFTFAQLQNLVRSSGGEIRAQSPNGDRFLIGFSGGENPQALEDMIERLGRSTIISDPAPDYLVFAN